MGSPLPPEPDHVAPVHVTDEALCEPCEAAPAMAFARQGRGCGLHCGGYDCGRTHVDVTAPGYLRGVAMPSLRVALLFALVATATAAVTEPTECTGITAVSRSLRYLQLSLTSLLVVVVARTLLIAPPDYTDASLADPEALARILAKKDAMAERLSAALRLETVSYDKEDASVTEQMRRKSEQALRDLHQHLERSFPLVRRHLKREVINEFSLVYEWEGSDASELPYAVYAHLDVVPAGERAGWKDATGLPVDAFGGVVREGEIWGRGAIDDKQAVLGQLEAVEDLLASGFKPRRTVYLCFGHDEETGGQEGARRIAEHLYSKGARLEFLLDEGLFVISGVLPLCRRPIAMVCLAEKGFLTLRLSIDPTKTGPTAGTPLPGLGAPGHASMPPDESSIGVLARAVSKLEKSPFPTHFNAAHRLFSALGGAGGPWSVVAANLWLFNPLLRLVLAAKPKTATLVRTTTALTVFKAGEKSNVLPANAYALVNHRLHPSDTIASVIARDRAVIDDPRIQIEIEASNEPSLVSQSDHPAFRAIGATVRELFPEALVAPGLFVAGSDSKHFEAVERRAPGFCPQIYRFNPIALSSEETAMFHGYNERIGVEAHAKNVAFMRSLHVRTQSRNATST